MVESNVRFKVARLITVVLSLLGLGLSYIALSQHVAYTHGFETGPSFCHINEHFNCEAVNASEWSVFLGVPIASYGLFFYSSLIILSLITRASSTILTTRGCSGVLLLLSSIASLLSLALLALSELVIGALCIMCIGLYLVNFTILGAVWWSEWRGRFVEGVSHGIKEIGRLIGVALALVSPPTTTAAWGVRGLGLMILLSAVGSFTAPSLIYDSMVEQVAARPVEDPVKKWREAPLINFDLKLSQGAFGDYFKGSEGAPIKIVEFADYECPACKVMSLNLKDLLSRYEGKYLFVFKNYPLDRSCNPEMEHDLHKYACIAARFSRCAGEQGKFWEAMESLFLREADKEELTLESLVTEGSKELSLDEQAILECMQSSRYDEKIQADIREGTNAGLMGTPSIWVNGRQVEAPSIEAIEAVFQSILADTVR